MKRILQYLKVTFSDGLLITPAFSVQLTAFSDADWAANPDDRKPVSGHVVLLGQRPVSWSSKKQFAVSYSSTKAKVCNLASATSDIMLICS